MPIRTKPFTSISVRDIEELMTREVQEDHTIDFKQELRLATRDEKSDLLKAVAGFANALGGTIVYGVQEGDGVDRGRIVALPGLQIDNSDAFKLQIEGIIRDGIDERLIGVLHVPVKRTDGKCSWVSVGVSIDAEIDRSERPKAVAGLRRIPRRKSDVTSEAEVHTLRRSGDLRLHVPARCDGPETACDPMRSRARGNCCRNVPALIGLGVGIRGRDWGDF